MKTSAMWRLFSPDLAGLLAIAAATALASPAWAEAVDFTYNIRLDGMSTGNCAGTVCGTAFGTVTVTGNTDSSLTYTVNLAPGVSFYAGDGNVFYFDLTDGGGPAITFSGIGDDGSGYSYSEPASGTYALGPDFPGPYNYAVSCTTRATGDLCGDSLTFTASGATSTDPFVVGLPPGGGVFASYDVPFLFDLSVAAGTPNLCTGDSACTGLVGAPEPSTWAMMLIGFAGLGWAAFRRSTKGRSGPVSI